MTSSTEKSRNSPTESASSAYIYIIETGEILAYTPSWWRSSWWLTGFSILPVPELYVVWLSFWATPRQSDKQGPRVSETAKMVSVLVQPFLPVMSRLPPQTKINLWDSQTWWSCPSTSPYACATSVSLHRDMRRQQCRNQVECWARRHSQKQDSLEEVVVIMKLGVEHRSYSDAGVLDLLALSLANDMALSLVNLTSAVTVDIIEIRTPSRVRPIKSC